MFLGIGHIPNAGAFKGMLDLDDDGYILTQQNVFTTLNGEIIPGVYACGDIQDRRYRQAITAAGSGCMAALEVEKYLEEYSSFMFLGLTSITAEGLNEHPALGKGVGGFYAYTWRGFLDKTDGTYLSAFFLPSLLHEDTRYHPLGHGHRIVVRALYVISRQGVALTYGGRQTPNFAGLGGKVLTQVISRNYYPAGSTDFGVLAEKFGYSVMRDVAFSSIREFYPDIAAHYIRKHQEKAARMSARDVNSVTP
jgi:hypothetical protein